MSLQDPLGVNLLVRCVSMGEVRGSGVVSSECECEKMCRCVGAVRAGGRAQCVCVRCFVISTSEPDFRAVCCRRTLKFSVASTSIGIMWDVLGSENWDLGTHI